MTGRGSAVLDQDLSGPSNGKRAAHQTSNEPGASQGSEHCRQVLGMKRQGSSGWALQTASLKCFIFYSRFSTVGAFTRSARQRLNCSLHTISNSPATLKEPPIFAFAFLFSFCSLRAFLWKRHPVSSHLKNIRTWWKIICSCDNITFFF